MDSLGSADSVGSVDSVDSLGSVGQSVSGIGQRWMFLAEVLPRATHFTRLPLTHDYTDVTLACEDGRLLEPHQAILPAPSPPQDGFNLLTDLPGRISGHLLRGGHHHPHLLHHQQPHLHQRQHEPWSPKVPPILATQVPGTPHPRHLGAPGATNPHYPDAQASPTGGRAEESPKLCCMRRWW